MALAILELLEVNERDVRFKIDTGTNTHYRLKIGREVRQDNGSELVDDVYFSTPFEENDASGDLFNSSKPVSLPLSQIKHGKSFVQLFSFKAGGKAQAASDVVVLHDAALMQSNASVPASLPGAPVMMNGARYSRARSIPTRSVPYATPASFENLLGEIVRIASPVVLNMLKGANGAATGGAAAGTAQPSAAGTPADLLAQVLRSVLNAVSVPAAGAVSQPASLQGPVGNRLMPRSEARFAAPMIFGVDDMLIASLAGPILNVLPQLMNAANQKRIQLRRADNQLVGGILSDINKRLLMDKLLEAQRGAEAQGPAAPIGADQIKAVAELLAQMPVQPVETPAVEPPPAPIVTPVVVQAPAATGTAAAAVGRPQSLASGDSAPHKLSERAVLEFTFAEPVEWNGTPKPVFDRSKPLLLRPRLVIAEPVPRKPLAKAILKVVLQDADNPAVRLEKTFKLKDVPAGAPVDCSFAAGELAHLPPNTRYSVLAELRWRNSKTGRETRALGSTELVLAGNSFVQARGHETSAERELVDLAVYRSFWNKVWEAPTLDGARSNGDNRKYSWELNVNARYAVLVSAAHDTNGIMETRILKEADEPDSLSHSVRGRMKGGIELSLSELNKLIALWNGPPLLDAATLEALHARPFLENAARELKYTFKLRGRAGQGGMVWVVPVFKLFAIALSTITATDATGQVTSTTQANVQFPLPVACRLIGLKSAA